MDLNNVDLLALQTKAMQKDPTTKGLCAALTPQLQDIANKARLCILLGRVDELPAAVLDELAYQLNITWYDAGAADEVKRALIKSSDLVHMTLGTPYAIEQVVADYFGDGYVEEWFEYGGDPFYFRVITSNTAVTGDLATQFANAIEKVKRKSTRLEQVIISMTAEMPIYFGNVIQTGDFITIEQVV